MSIKKISSILLKQFSLINVYGKSGTGKTTYAMQLLWNFFPTNFTKNRSNFQTLQEPIFVWVQGSERFPKKRLKEMYKNNKTKLNYLQTHILLYPKFLITSYEELCSRLIQFPDKHSSLPFNPTAIIIDNISHYLRLEISKYDDISLVTALLDDFFDTVIVPLIFYCGRRGIILILIHEVTYNPRKDEVVMFNHHLFSNLKSLNIKLEKDPISKKQTISFHYQNYKRSFNYKLQREGIQLIT
ncbi:MAG: hypothetical protein EU547_05555 [Promethearchaeota archaeon]|nr:MAG: hypothetical protein EU547_05555 [Candidatus Lokiarchaeota archaeon]